MKDTFDLQNPWRNSGYVFPDEPYIKRNIFNILMEDLHKKRITVLLGARQVGKTFLIKKMIKKLLAGKEVDSRQIFYFNFDAFNLIDLVKNDRDFIYFIKSYGVADKRTYIFLDEAQRIPDAGLLIKKYYDLGHDIKFIVSGSSSLQIKGQTKETLTGRKTLFEMYPVSYREFLKFNGVEPPDNPELAVKFEAGIYQRLMEEFIRFGGYPGVVVTDSSEDKMNLLKEIYNSYIQKDISDFLKIEDVSGFNRMVQFLSAQTASLCKINEVAKNVRLSRHFVEKYLLALEETYVITLLRPYFTNLGKAIIKTPKLYFYDTGLRNAVFGEFQSLDNRADIGAIIENFVFSELIKSIEKDRLWFYRTTTGSEIDFLFVKGNKTIPIEVKYRISGQKAYPKTFNTLLKHTNFKKALVISRDYSRKRKIQDIKILYIPACVLYGIGSELTGRNYYPD